MQRSILVLFCIGLSTVAAAQSSLEENESYLENYIGSWEGEMSIHSSEGELLRTFPVAAEYWREKQSVKGLTAFEVEGEMRFAETRNYLRNRLLFADVTQNGNTVTYRGYLEKGAVFWIPYDAALVTERRMKEWFETENGSRILHVEGRELLRSGEGTAIVKLTARLILQD